MDKQTQVDGAVGSEVGGSQNENPAWRCRQEFERYAALLPLVGSSFPYRPVPPHKGATMTLTPKELEIKERCELEALERLSDLRVIRKSKGIGLRQAARQIGISATYLAHIETGRVPLPKTNNEKFEAFFGVRFPRSDEWQKGYSQAKTEGESTISTLREQKDRYMKAFRELKERLDLAITEGGHGIRTNRGLCGASVHMPYTYAAIRELARPSVAVQSCDDEPDHDLYQESEQCGCKVCVCMNRTEYGEVCIECSSGAHQG